MKTKESNGTLKKFADRERKGGRIVERNPSCKRIPGGEPCTSQSQGEGTPSKLKRKHKKVSKCRGGKGKKRTLWDVHLGASRTGVKLGLGIVKGRKQGKKGRRDRVGGKGRSVVVDVQGAWRPVAENV